MKYWTKVRLALSGCFFLLGLQASTAQKAWSLLECIDYALVNNIAVKQNEVSAELARLSVAQSRYSMLPTLNTSVGRNYNFGRTIDPFTNQFTTQQVESDNWSLNTGVTLFNGFQLQNTLKQSQLNYLAGKSDLQKIKNDISLNVISSYLQVLYTKEQMKVAQARVEQSREQRDRILRLVNAGSAVQGTLLDAEAQLTNEELSRITAENQLISARLAITQLLQLNSPEGFDVLDPSVEIPAENILSMTPAQLYDLALANLPEIKAADNRILSAEKGVSIAKAALMPRLSAFGQLSSFYSSSAKTVAGVEFEGLVPNGVTTAGDTVLVPSFNTRLADESYRNQLDQNYNKAFGLSLSVPLFNGFNGQFGVRRARLNLENARYASQQVRNQLYQSIQQAHTDAQAAAKRYEATARSLRSFEESYSYAEKRFNAGLINSLEYLTVTNNVTRSKVELLQAKYDYIFRLKVLDFYAGKPLGF